VLELLVVEEKLLRKEFIVLGPALPTIAARAIMFRKSILERAISPSQPASMARTHSPGSPAANF